MNVWQVAFFYHTRSGHDTETPCFISWHYLTLQPSQRVSNCENRLMYGRHEPTKTGGEDNQKSGKFITWFPSSTTFNKKRTTTFGKPVHVMRPPHRTDALVDDFELVFRESPWQGTCWVTNPGKHLTRMTFEPVFFIVLPRRIHAVLPFSHNDLEGHFTHTFHVVHQVCHVCPRKPVPPA